MFRLNGNFCHLSRFRSDSLFFLFSLHTFMCIGMCKGTCGQAHSYTNVFICSWQALVMLSQERSTLATLPQQCNLSPLCPIKVPYIWYPEITRHHCLWSWQESSLHSPFNLSIQTANQFFVMQTSVPVGTKPTLTKLFFQDYRGAIRW